MIHRTDCKCLHASWKILVVRGWNNTPGGLRRMSRVIQMINLDFPHPHRIAILRVDAHRSVSSRKQLPIYNKKPNFWELCNPHSYTHACSHCHQSYLTLTQNSLECFLENRILFFRTFQWFTCLLYIVTLCICHNNVAYYKWQNF